MTNKTQETAQETQTTTEAPVYMEPTIAVEVDKEKGINQPGVTQGMTYTDSNGKVRHKYETLSSLSPQTIESLMSNNKGARNEKTEEAPKQKKADPVDEKPKSDVSTEVDVTNDEPVADADSEVKDVKVETKPEVEIKSTKKKK